MASLFVVLLGAKCRDMLSSTRCFFLRSECLMKSRGCQLFCCFETRTDNALSLSVQKTPALTKCGGKLSLQPAQHQRNIVASDASSHGHKEANSVTHRRCPDVNLAATNVPVESLTHTLKSITGTSVTRVMSFVDSSRTGRTSRGSFSSSVPPFRSSPGSLTPR